tara:strand:+ start:9564 stop:9788 length:225 start_codon:yes stop_codon:yes gene_type:complete
MLQAAIDVEVDDFLAEHSGRRDEQGRRLVVRNGSLPEREILTGPANFRCVNRESVTDLRGTIVFSSRRRCCRRT